MKEYNYPLLTTTTEESDFRVDVHELDQELKVNLLDVHNDIGKIDKAHLAAGAREMIQLSKCDQFQGKAFYLDSSYDWVIGRTTGNRIVLVPLDPKYPAKRILKQLKKHGGG